MYVCIYIYMYIYTDHMFLVFFADCEADQIHPS